MDHVWWDEPVFFQIRRSLVPKIILVFVFVFYATVPIIAGKELVKGITAGMTLDLVIVVFFLYRRRITVSAQGIRVVGMPPIVLRILPILPRISTINAKYSNRSEIKRIVIQLQGPCGHPQLMVERKYNRPYVVGISRYSSMPAIQEALDRFEINYETAGPVQARRLMPLDA